MNKAGKQSEFDIEAIRKKVAEHGASRVQEAGPPVELNPFARRVAEQYQEEKFSPAIIKGMFRGLDLLALTLCGLFAHAVSQPLSTADFSNVAIWVLAGGLGVLFMQMADCYQVPLLRRPLAALGRNAGAWTLALIIAVCFDFAVDTAGFSGTKMLAWFACGSIYLFLQRPCLAAALRHWMRNGILERRAVVVCGGKPAQDLIRSLESQPDNDIRILGIFDDRFDHRSPDLVAGYPKLGSVSELIEFVRLAHVDMLIISLPLSAETRILDMLRKLWILPVDIRLAAHASKLRFRPRAYSHVGRMQMFDVFDKPIRDWDSVAKRAFDLFFATVAILCLWPVMLAAAIAVKATSKGPIFFVQKRHGFNNEIINVFKFRSMYTDMGDQTATQAVTKGDPRVTPVGRFLRKSSIDELPQLFNVIRGDLSLVGPRPHAVAARTHDRIYSEIVEGYFGRHRVKPGVTGWAQINGWRGEIDSDDKIRFRTVYDLHYIENWSLLFDLKILFLTPFRLLNTENAY